MMRWIGIGLPFAVVLGLVVWRIVAKEAGASELQNQQKMRAGASPSVEVAVAQSHPILESIEVLGSVEAAYTVKLSPKLSGRIEYLEVREGDHVTPGQPLVRIDPSEVDAQIRQQQANVAEARSRLAQAQLTAGATATGVQSAVKVQNAAVASAKAELDQQQKTYDAQVSSAQADVDDAAARVSSAQSAVKQRSAELIAAKAAEANAKGRLDRAQSLLAKGYVAQQTVDDAQSTYAQKQADTGVAQQAVSSANNAVDSAKAQKTSAEKRMAVVKEQGKAGILTAKAKLEQAKASYAEAVANTAQNPAYKENLKALAAGVSAAEAGLGQLQAQRENTVLTSPIEGTVTERTADPGTLATPGQTLVTIDDLKWVFVTANVPIENGAKIYKGQRVQVRLDAFEGKVFEGKIGQISQSADPQSRQFAIKVRLENSNSELRPGMFARLNVVTRELNPLVVVPITAVNTGRAGSTVTVIDAEDKAERRDVKTGASDKNSIAIEEGLKPGEKVVTLSYAPVRDGQKVKVGKGTEGQRDKGTKGSGARG